MVSGNLTLTGNNTFSGTTVVGAPDNTLSGQGSLLTLNYTASGATQNNILASNSRLTLNANGAIVFNGATALNNQTFAGLNVNGGGARITSNNVAGGTIAVNLGVITRAIGGTLDIESSVWTAQGIRATAGAGWTLSGIVKDTNGAAFAVFNNWAAGNNPQWCAWGYGGTGIVSGSIVTGFYTSSTPTSLSGNASMTSGGNVTLSANTAISSLRNTSTAALAITGSNALTVGGIILSPAASGTYISGGTLRATGNDLPIFTGANSYSYGISSLIADNGSTPVAVVKTGNAFVNLSNTNNTFSGGLFLGSQTANAAAKGSSGAAQPFNEILGGTVTSTNPNGIKSGAYGVGPITIGAGNQIFGSGPIYNVLYVGAGASDLGCAIRNDAGTTIGGPVNIIDNVTLTGGTNTSQTWVFTNNATFAGPSSVTMTLGATNATSNTYQMWTPGSTFAGTILLGSGTNTMVAQANNAFAPLAAYNLGGTNNTLSFVTYSAAIGSLSGSGTLSVGSGTAIIGGNNLSSSYSGVITGVGNLIKVGGGVLTFKGTQSLFTGTTTISGGAIAIAADASLGAAPGSFASARLTLDGGALITAAGYPAISSNRGIYLTANGGILAPTVGASFWVNSVISGPGSLIMAGAGTTALATAETYTGATCVNMGRLVLASGAGTNSGSFANSSNVVIGAAGTLSMSAYGLNASSSNLLGSGGVSGAGTLEWSGTGTLAFNNSLSSFNGSMTVGVLGTVQIGNGGTSGSLGGASSVAVSGTLAINRGDTTLSLASVMGTSALSGSGVVRTLTTNTVALDYAVPSSFNGTFNFTNAAQITGGQNFGAVVTLGNTTWDLQGTNALIDGLVSTGGVGMVTNTGALATLAINGTVSSTYSGTIAGPINLYVASGTQAFTGASGTSTIAGAAVNSYSGTTGVGVGGVLSLGGGGTLTGTFVVPTNTINVAGTLALNHADTFNWSGSNLQGTGTLQHQGLGTLNITGASPFSGSVVVSAGSVQITNGGSLANVTNFNLASTNATLGLYQTGSSFGFTNYVSGAGNVILQGTAVTTFGNASNSFNQLVLNANTTANVNSLGNQGAASFVGTGAVYVNGLNTTINWTGGSGTSTRNIQAANVTGCTLNFYEGTANVQLAGTLNNASNFQWYMNKFGSGVLTLGQNLVTDADNAYFGVNLMEGSLVLNKYNGRAANLITGTVGTTIQIGLAGSNQANWQVNTLTLYGTFDLNGYSTKIVGLVGSAAATGIVTTTKPGGVTLSNWGTGIYSGLIQDGAGQMSYTQYTSAETLGGANTYSGTTTIYSGGAINVNVLANGGQPSGIGQSPADARYLVLGSGSSGGTIGYIGTVAASTDRNFTLNAAGGTIAANAGMLIWNGSPAPITASTTLYLGGAGTNNNQFAGTLVDNGDNVLSVAKSGTGVWSLSNPGNNLYSGNTTIRQGALRNNAGDGMLSPNSLVVINGTSGSEAVLESNMDFTASLGGSAGSISIPGGTSGLSANGGPANVNLNGGATFNWGDANFNPATLVLNGANADSVITLQNSIYMTSAGGNVTRSIGVFATNRAAAGYIPDTAKLVENNGGTLSLNKVGPGTLVLGNAPQYHGSTTISAGVLQINGTSLGNSPALFFNGPGTMLEIGNSADGSAFSTTALITTATGWMALGNTTTNDATFSGNIQTSQDLDIWTVGQGMTFGAGTVAGNVVIAGATNSAARLMVKNGAAVVAPNAYLNLTMSGGGIQVGVAAGDSGMLVVNGGTINAVVGNSTLNVGYATGAMGTLKMQAGQITLGYDTFIGAGSGTGLAFISGGAINIASTHWMYVGGNGSSTGYGVVKQTGGTLNLNGGILQIGDDQGGGAYDLLGGTILQQGNVNWSNAYPLEMGGNVNAGGASSFYMGGGNVSFSNNTSWCIMTGFNGGPNNLTIAGGSMNANLGMALGYAGGGTMSSTFNMQGGTLNITGGNNGIHVGQNSGSAGEINLNGGTIITPCLIGYSAAATSQVNFHGGTLVVQTNTAVGATFMSGFAQGGAYIWSEGAIIDTGTNVVTISSSLLAPWGQGVQSIDSGTWAGHLSFVAHPVVNLVGGGGTGAAAVANLDPASGALQGFTITNPGVGYTSAPTAILYGGWAMNDGVGGSNAIILNTGITLSDNTTNTAGGLTKNGNGMLTLTGNNTFGGPLVINGGSLTLGGTGFAAPIYGTGDLIFSTSSTLNFTGTIGTSGNVYSIGSGTVALSGVNTNGGSTFVQQGVYRAVDGVGLSPNTALVLASKAGGTVTGDVVFETSGNFSRTLGTLAGQVFVGGSNNVGFSAYGGAATIALNGGGPLAWGDANFLSNPTSSLVLQSPVANAVLTLNNSLSLTADTSPVTRTIVVNSTNGASAAAYIPNAITDNAPSGGLASLIKSGAGTLVLGAAPAYSGSTIVNAGVLQINDTTLGTTSGLTLSGGSLQIGNASGGFSTSLPVSLTASSYLGNTSVNNAAFNGSIVSSGTTQVLYVQAQGFGVAPGAGTAAGAVTLAGAANVIGDLRMQNGTTTLPAGSTFTLTNNDNRVFTIGYAAGDNATLNITGATIVSTNITSAEMDIGYNAASSPTANIVGVVNMYSGSINLPHQAAVIANGYNTIGYLNMHGGSISGTNAGIFGIGWNQGFGQLNMDGGSITSGSGGMAVGYAANALGVVYLSGGTITTFSPGSQGGLTVGSNASANGAMRMTGGVLNVGANRINIGYNGVGAFDWLGGTIQTAPPLTTCSRSAATASSLKAPCSSGPTPEPSPPTPPTGAASSLTPRTPSAS